MSKENSNESIINLQIKLAPADGKILRRFTKDRSKSMGGFLVDLLYVLENKMKNPEELEKFFGNLMYKKYFEER
jgi:hypothetical protein